MVFLCQYTSEHISGDLGLILGGIPLVSTTTAVGQLFIAEKFSYIYANFLAEDFHSNNITGTFINLIYSVYHHVHYTSA
jgi:hypothetical protein